MKNESYGIKKKQQKSDTFHAVVKSCERRGGVYLVHLRLFDFVVEDRYVSISEYVSKTSIANKFDVNCPTSEVMPNKIFITKDT